MSSSNPLAGPSALRDVINPQFHQNNFPAETHIKTELGLKLDKGEAMSGRLQHWTTHSCQTNKYVDLHWLQPVVLLDLYIVLCGIQRPLSKTSNHHVRYRRTLAKGRDCQRFANIGCVVYVKKVTHASFCMSITYGGCPNAGGLPSTGTALQVMSVFTLIQKNGELNAQIITEASAN